MRFYKRTFHAQGWSALSHHRSDGRGTPEEVERLHARHGYDFLALTDHNFYNYADYAPETGLLIIPGMEIDAEIDSDLGMCFHSVCIGPAGKRATALPRISGRSTPT